VVGRTLAQYRIEEKLGEGGMGAVYRAFDTRLKRDVAIKILRRSEEGTDELTRLLAEARAAAPLNHPAISTIHEVGEEAEVCFIVMELVTGGTLRQACGGEACAAPTLARIGLEVALGLQAAHEHGVIHGDIKSDDLMAMLSLGEIAAFEGDHPAAQERYERTLALDPSHVYGNMFVQTGLLYLDELDRAEKALVRARGIIGEDSLLRSAEALLWAKRGEAQRAEEHIRRALDDLTSLSHAHHTRHYVAAALATIGQPERALQQLRLAARTGLPNYPLFRDDHHFDALRVRPDFRDFLAELEPGYQAFRREFGRGG